MNTINQRTVGYWFAQLRNVSFNVATEHHGRQVLLEKNNNELRAIVEADPSKATEE